MELSAQPFRAEPELHVGQPLASSCASVCLLQLQAGVPGGWALGVATGEVLVPAVALSLWFSGGQEDRTVRQDLGEERWRGRCWRSQLAGKARLWKELSDGHVCAGGGE